MLRNNGFNKREALYWKKVFWSKKTLQPLKGKKRKRKVIIESDWQTYQSSSNIVKEEIKKKGIDNFKFEILSLHKDRSSLNYHELVWQIQLNVLDEKLESGERKYYNANIALRYYPTQNIEERDNTRKLIMEHVKLGR